MLLPIAAISNSTQKLPKELPRLGPESIREGVGQRCQGTERKPTKPIKVRASSIFRNRKRRLNSPFYPWSALTLTFVSSPGRGRRFGEFRYSLKTIASG